MSLERGDFKWVEGKLTWVPSKKGKIKRVIPPPIIKKIPWDKVKKL